jgi:2-keto-4-pentenoate hydratase
MDRIDLIAEKLASAWFAKARHEMLAGERKPSGLNEAYDVQRALQEKFMTRRGPIAGRKIALSSKAMQTMVGIDHPVAGAFFAADIRRSPATLAASEFRHLGIEYELAFELARNVSPEMAPHDADTVHDLIQTVRPAFELVEDRDADYAQLDALNLVAENAWCGGVVLGDEISDWRDLDLSDLPVTLHQNGQNPERANTGAADPLGSLAWVLNHFARRGETLASGEIIITGSVMRTRFPTVGDQFRYEIDGKAEVILSLV